MAREVEVKDVQLGEQPNHAEPPTHEELKEAKQTNTPIVLGHWKEIQDLFTDILEKVKIGTDPETMQMRSWIQVQAHTVGIKVENLTKTVGK